MADKAPQSTAGSTTSYKKFSYTRSNSPENTGATVPTTEERKGGAATPVVSPSARPTVPKLGSRPAPQTMPPQASYPSGSQTQRSSDQSDRSAAAASNATASSSLTGAGTAAIGNAVLMRHNLGSGMSPAPSAAKPASSLMIKLPRQMPALPLPGVAATDGAAPPPPSDPPPPPDAPTPPLKTRPETASTPRQPASSLPVFADDISSLRSGQASPTINKIAADIVAAELANGLNLKQIGRASPKLNGVSVYNQLAAYVNREMLQSDFIDVVEECRQAVSKKFAKNPEKLVSVEGSATTTTGEHTGVDLKRIAGYLAPVFEFVCGAGQQLAESRLPKRVLSLFKAIDRELVAVLLARREQQLLAQKIWTASLPPEELKSKLAGLGWTDAHFKKLVNEGVFTAANIQAFRTNMVTGLVFTRCVSPFILFSAEELQQESGKRIASPSKSLVKLSEGANKLFKNDYKPFVADFISESHSVLPEKSALALATITSGEERYSRVKTSKKKSSGGSKAFSRSPGRHSAPVLPQGGEFRELMEKEKKATDAESSSPGPRRRPVDYKTRRDAAIDKFKSSHAEDFGDEDFGIAFGSRLREWKRANSAIAIEAVPLAMKQLYQQMKKDLAEEAGLERDGPPVQSPTRNMGNSSSRTSSATTMSTSTSNAPVPAVNEAMLSDDRKEALERFAKKSERQHSFERYPALMRRIGREAIAWAQKKTGGNFVLALKTIYEKELLKCFHGTYRLMDDTADVSLDTMGDRVAKWKSANEGMDVNLEVLWTIMPDLMPPLGLDTVKATPLTRNAEAIIEELLRHDEAGTEMKNTPLLKKQFLHEARSWIAHGASVANPAFAIRQIYHDALIAHYRESLIKAGADPVQAGKIRLEALERIGENDEAVLTRAELGAIFAAIKKSE